MSLYHVVLVLAVILLLLGFAAGGSWNLMTREHVGQLITDLEDYKKQNGTYPDEVDEFMKNRGYGKFGCSDGKLPMGYLTYNEQTEFLLSCFGRGPTIFSGKVWEVYTSETGKWTTISDYDEGSEMGETGR